MENEEEKKLLTPERALSESEEEQKTYDLPTPYPPPKSAEEMPGLNMPRIIDPAFMKRAKEYTNEPLSTLAKRLETTTVLKGNFDLDELMRKQEDLMLIKELIENNLQGIQDQINKRSSKKSASKTKHSFRYPQGPKYYKKFEDSDGDSKYAHNSRSAHKNNDLSKSFSRTNTQGGFGAGARGKNKCSDNRVSMIEKPIDKSHGDISMRSRSTIMPRRRREERKQSVEQNNRRSIENSSRAMGSKPTATDRLSKHLDQEQLRNFNESTTNETHTNGTFKKNNVSRFDPSDRSDKMSTVYSSNAPSNVMTQLRCS